MLPALACSLCLAHAPALPALRPLTLAQEAPASAAPAAPEAPAGPEPELSRPWLATGMVSTLVLLDGGGVAAAAASQLPARRLGIDGLGALGGVALGSALLGGLAYFIFLDPANLRQHQSRDCGEIVGALLITIYAFVLGGVMGPPVGVLVADRLQGNPVAWGGLGLSALASAASAATALFVLGELDEAHPPEGVKKLGWALGALGVGAWSTAGYALLAHH